MTEPPAVDILSTANCPLGHRCESCGDEHAELAVATRRTSAGAVCLTLCPVCIRFMGPPPISVGTATNLAAQHVEHVASAPPGGVA